MWATRSQGAEDELPHAKKGTATGTILLLVLILLLLGALPSWPYRRNGGYTPVSIVGLLLVVLLLLLIFEVLP